MPVQVPVPTITQVLPLAPLHLVELLALPKASVVSPQSPPLRSWSSQCPGILTHWLPGPQFVVGLHSIPLLLQVPIVQKPFDVL